MTDQPSRITLAELSALIDQLRQLAPDTPLTERIVYHQQKAWLLDAIALAQDTPEACQVASQAWQQVADQRRPGTGVTP